jgi:hypothetical protein
VGAPTDTNAIVKIVKCRRSVEGVMLVTFRVMQTQALLFITLSACLRFVLDAASVGDRARSALRATSLGPWPPRCGALCEEQGRRTAKTSQQRTIHGAVFY